MLKISVIAEGLGPRRSFTFFLGRQGLGSVYEGRESFSLLMTSRTLWSDLGGLSWIFLSGYPLCLFRLECCCSGLESWERALLYPLSLSGEA